ncbi:MAG TPA: PQQ-binding-like beta-propeller repeat protein, partial [Gemmataceae bacterium]|nr:PQQ-binding-like beta-propeller repeat protein [Gemmataceae bacterium]
MKRLFALLFLVALVPALHADDWPQWRGPRRDGVSLEKGLLKKWPKEGPTIAWQFKNAGLGFSSFAVRDGKVYTLGSRDDSEIVLVLDAATGKELWTAKIGPVVNAPENSTWGDGPRSTPTLDGNLLYALGSQSDLVCVDLSKNGAEVWRKNLEKDFGGKLMTGWGYAESPLVDGAQLFVSPGGEKGSFIALDKKTGKQIWRCTDVKQTAPYSSAMPADFGGVHQYVQASYVAGTGGFLNGIDAKTGKLLWQAQMFKKDSYLIAPTPIVTDKYVYDTSHD